MSDPAGRRALDPGLTQVASHLLARYAWAIDDRDFDSLREVFTEDVVADYGAFTCTGASDLVARMAQIHHGLRTTQHIVGSVLAAAEEGGAVRVRSHVRATLVREGGERGRVEVAATYRDVMVPAIDGHLIAQRRVEGHWIAGERSILPWFHAAPTGTAATRPDDRGI